MSPILSAVYHSTVILKETIKIISSQEILIKTYVFIDSYQAILQM